MIGSYFGGGLGYFDWRQGLPPGMLSLRQQEYPSTPLEVTLKGPYILGPSYLLPGPFEPQALPLVIGALRGFPP